MDLIQSPIGVLIILGLVAIAALSYVPPGFLGNYKRLAERYETDRRPGSISFPGTHVMIGRLFGGPRFFADNVGEFARFDIALDSDGFWLLYDGPMPKKAPDCMLVPWNKIVFKREKRGTYYFDVEASDPVEISVSTKLGSAIKDKSAVLANEHLEAN